MAKKKPPDPALPYTWFLTPDDGLRCYVDKSSYQTVTKLRETTELTPFHDAELAQATKEVNKIINGLEKSNADPERKLSFIRFRNQHFLVWARYGAVGQLDEEKTVINALKLRVK